MEMLQVGWIWVWLLLAICSLFMLFLVVSLSCPLVFNKLYREELLPLEQQETGKVLLPRDVPIQLYGNISPS